MACLFVGLGVATPGTAAASTADPSPEPSSTVTEPADVAPAVVRWAHVWADRVNVRECQRLHCQVVTQVNNGWYPYICTVDGDQVTYGQYTNFYWTRISIDTNGDGYYETTGFLSDVFVSGGRNNEPAIQPPTWRCYH